MTSNHEARGCVAADDRAGGCPRRLPRKRRSSRCSCSATRRRARRPSSSATCTTSSATTTGRPWASTSPSSSSPSGAAPAPRGLVRRAATARDRRDTTVRLQLWDIAGQDRFGAIARVRHRGVARAAAARGTVEIAGLLQGRVRRVPRLRHQPTGDVQDHRRARRDSRRARAAAFLRLERTDRLTTSRDDRDSQVKWKDEIDSKVHLPNGMALPVVLLANKCDLEDVAIDRQELDDFCRSHGFIGWFETSAKADVNIDTAARRPRPAGPSPGNARLCAYGNATRRAGAEPRGQHPQPRRRLFGETRGADEARQDDEAGRAGGQEPQRGLLLGARLLAPRRTGPPARAAPGRPPASYLVTPRSPCARRAPRLLSRTRPTRPPPSTRRSGGAAAAPSRRRRGASRR